MEKAVSFYGSLELKMRQIYRPIETKAGVLRARDAIFVDDFVTNLDVNSIKIIGTLGTVAIDTNNDLSYTMTFVGVRCFKVIDGDVGSDEGVSCFDEVVNSQWVAALGYKDQDDLRHYSVATYDDIIDVVCSGYDLEIFGI